MNYNYPYLNTNPYYGGANYQSPYQQPNNTNIMQPQQQVQQPQTQQQYQTQYDIPIQGVKFVTEEEAKAYIVYPNQRVMLIDKANGKFAIKTGSSLGESAMEWFNYKPSDDTNAPKQEPIPQIDTTEFVKKTDIKDFGFITADKFEETIKSLKNDFAKSFDEIKKSNIKRLLDSENK